VCGIAGIWNRDGAPVERAGLARMAAALRHRGPDGEGFHLEDGLGLASRRLAIVDLSERAAQPMRTADGALTLVYNGEVHNWLELRAELEARGVAFRSDSDTEVVLEAFRLWGPACLDRFNGMWALALWDARARRLLLARDRFGIKPLVWSVRGPRVAFASEAKAILAAFPAEREPDPAELHAFLAGAAPDGTEATFFRAIRNVPPGALAVIEPDGERIETWWRFEPGVEAPQPDVEERFRHLLDDAVRIRLRSDAPLGVLVSGGLDSSAVLRLAAPRVTGAVPCFSLAYDRDPEVDESRFARLAAAGLEHDTHWVRPTADGFLEGVRAIVRAQDGPTPLRGRFAHWFTMREVGRHVRVALVGEGSDELLAGYIEMAVPYALDRLRLGGRNGAGRVGLLPELVRLAQVHSRPWAFARTAAASELARTLRLPRRTAGADPLLAGGGRVFPPAPPQRRPGAWRHPAVPRPYASHLNNALWYSFRQGSFPELLHAGDALSMSFSVETRMPFLDHRLVELCFSLPFYEKIGDGWTKSLLRRALRGVLPEPIRTRRRKLGFPAPVGRWMTGSAWPDVLDVLLDPRTLDRGVVEPAAMRRRLAGGGAEGRQWVRRRVDLVWKLLTVELWHREFLDAHA
jgi:asparagine synthase (glutamine-hydrolysing)